MSNSQWHEDQVIGDRALLKAEKIKVAERKVLDVGMAFRRAIKKGTRREIEGYENALDDAIDALLVLVDS